MSIQSVLLPVLVEVGLIFALFVLLSASRYRAFRGGLDPQAAALSGDAFSPRAKQAANAFAHQFEVPMLFFFAVIFGIVLHQTGWVFVIVEWVFVGFRIAHAGEHVTANRVRLRGPLFLGSVIAAALLWLLIFAGVYLPAVSA